MEHSRVVTTATDARRIGGGAAESHAGPAAGFELCQQLWARLQVARARQNAHLAAERLRVLHKYAHQGCHVPDEVFASARDHFSEEELVNLTIAVIATNGWNRLNIACRPEVGEYRPGTFDQPKMAQAAI